MKGAISYDVRGDMSPILRDLDKVQKELVPAATVSALNRTARHIRSASIKLISAMNNVPQKALRKKVLFGKRGMATRMRQSCAIYLKPRPLNPWAISKARAKREARIARGWALPPGFTSKPQSAQRKGLFRGGNDRGGNVFPKGIVLKRKGKPRYPTEKVGIPLLDATDTLRGEVSRSGPFFVRQFQHELKYRLERRNTLAARADMAERLLDAGLDLEMAVDV